jgi:phosphohistidine phosphatase
MKRLILVRHAKTEPLTDAASDYERKLKKRGLNDAALVADDLKSRAYVPDVLIASPAKRALQTAQIYAKTYGIPDEDIKQAMFVYDGDTTARMLDAIAGLAGNAETVMVVGHNPDMATLSMLLAREDFYHFPTCAASVIAFSITDWKDLNVGQGRSEYFVFPKMLKNNKA